MAAQPDFSLCAADAATFWPWRRWPQFAEWPEKERAVVVLPVAGMADWGLNRPFDAEEALLLGLLEGASRRLAPAPWLLCLPPLRFVAGPAAQCAFAVEVPVAQAAIEEWAAWVASAGFRRILLYNSSPWNEEVCAAVARDLHVDGLDLFCLHLSALGFDFDGRRQPDRARVATVLAELDQGGGALVQSGAAQLAALLESLHAWEAPAPS